MKNIKESALILAAGENSLNINKYNQNIKVLNTIDGNYKLPENKYSMFTMNQNQNLGYLVGINSLYTDAKNYMEVIFLKT